VSKVERPTEEELQAYVDDRLVAERRVEIEAYLLANPAIATRIRSYRKSRQDLHEAFQARLEEPIPRRLRMSTITAGLRQARVARALSAVTACFCLVFGFLLGWYTSSVLDPDIPLLGASTQVRTLKHDATSAHRLLAAVGPADTLLTAEEAQLQRWVQRRVGESFKIPDLSEFGMHFMGGQILPYKHDNAVALLLYRDDKGGRVTVYLRAGEHGDATLRSARLDDTLVFYWLDSRCGYVVAAAPDLERLSNIATAVYDYFERPSSDGRRL
jgi:anti-sigma factor RsiW